MMGAHSIRGRANNGTTSLVPSIVIHACERTSQKIFYRILLPRFERIPDTKVILLNRHDFVLIKLRFRVDFVMNVGA